MSENEMSARLDIQVIMLAAGLSRRMGARNKLLLEIDGEPLVRRSAKAYLACSDHVTVVLGHEAERVRAALAGLPVSFVDNLDYAAGQQSSVRAGLARVKPEGGDVLIGLADQPLLRAEDLHGLLAAFADEGGETIVIPYRGADRGNPIVLPLPIALELKRRGEAADCRRYIDEHPELTRRYRAPNANFVTDMDTPEDAARLGVWDAPALVREPSPLLDRFGRTITYLRLSVTDRCDLRCTYCMAERMSFLPKSEVLTLEELSDVGEAFIDRGVRKIRITGGEPLVRPNIIEVFNRLGDRLGDGLDELTLTTNATQLPRYADRLRDAGVRRVNVSLDSLDRATFEAVTRRDQLAQALEGVDAALAAGLKVKINTVALKDRNVDELPDMIAWAHGRGMDMTLIEVMPLGETGEDRFDQYIPLPDIRARLEKSWTLTDRPRTDANGGPSAYVDVAETGGALGFITPLTNNFCAGCNRVRVTCTGRIYMCLGQDDHVDLREALRTQGDLNAALDRALAGKPERHEFEIERQRTSGLTRHMSTTGG